jgi:general secretion pathway protein G
MIISKNKSKFYPVSPAPFQKRAASFGAFTLIELLVVISIIGLLSSIVLVSVNKAREKAKIAKAKVEIQQIITAMELYRDDYGQLPPIGDNCSAWGNPCDSNWVAVMDALVADRYISRIDKDPWGHYYCYDDNDNVCCGGCSPIYSMGPNGINDSWYNCPRIDGCPQSICNDDIGQILPYGDRPYPW